MKTFVKLFLAAVLLVGLSSCGGYSYESVKGDPSATRIYTLDNGLKVYMIVNHDAPRIDAQIAVKVGSKNDPRQTTGLAHYFEHLMFKGTDKFGTQNYELEKPMLDQIESLFETYRQTEDEALRKELYRRIDSISYEASKIAIPNEYDKLMASIGASGTNAYTSYDVTCYVENIPSNQIDNWAAIQADRFRNCVLRGFHTELETIYEEYNMYSAMDQTKLVNAVFEGLFEHHPYNTDVIGLPEHLKNPSITNVKKYHDEWYVPNNMAVVLSGDFDPDEAIKIIDRHFGVLEPNQNLVRPTFEPEAPIEKPVVKDVLGNESPALALAWRFPGANDANSLLLDLMSQVLSNGTAGLIDLDVNQKQKVLSMDAMAESLADYSAFLIYAEPKAGQTLDEVKSIAIEEIEKVKSGDFDEELLESIVNNMKYQFMNRSESTRFMAMTAVNSFVNDDSWENCYVNYIDRLDAVTKDELVAFAKENFRDNYVQVNKLQQKDPNDTRIAKPQITPIFTNRDTSSLFLRQMQLNASSVKPIEPVFLDFGKDLDRTATTSGIEVICKKNITNGTFKLDYVFDRGRASDKLIAMAGAYLEYLGTDTMTPEQVKKEFYRMACNFGISSTDDRTYVYLSGLSDNMKPAMQLMEEVIAGAVPNEEALSLLKANTLLERENAKSDQRSNFSMLRSYALYGPLNPRTNILSAAELNELTGETLVDKIHNLFADSHMVTYYGPLPKDEFLSVLAECHKTPDTLNPVNDGNPFPYVVTGENEVFVAPYDANQLQLSSVSCRGEKFDKMVEPIATLYNEYFGGAMNSIVFQEMREARGLAYSAWAYFRQPDDLDHSATFIDMIYTQNDKLFDALDAFDGIINDMPVSQKSFDVAKESILSNMRTQRTVKSGVIDAYLDARRRGLDYDLNRDIYEKVQGYTIDDVVSFQQQHIKDRTFRTVILGRESDIDFKTLEKYGKVTKLTTSQLFGY